MNFSRWRARSLRQRLSFSAVLLASTVITPAAMAQALPSLLVGAGGGGASGADGNGGSGGGGGGIGGGGGGSGYGYNGGAGGGVYGTGGLSVGGGAGASNINNLYLGTGGVGGSAAAYTNVTGGTGGQGSSGGGGGGIGGGGGGGGFGNNSENGNGGGGGGAADGSLGNGGQGGNASSGGGNNGVGGSGGAAANLIGGDGTNASGFSSDPQGTNAGGGGGGGGGGGSGGVGGNGGYGYPTTQSATKGGTGGPGNDPSYQLTINNKQVYGLVGVGGGGGGGGGGGDYTYDQDGEAGVSGFITIDNGGSLSTDLLMIGGGGGGGGGGSGRNGPPINNNGGAGGNGGIIVNGDAASLTVMNALLIGGEGGANGVNGGVGGAGGNGSLSIENGGRLVLVNGAFISIPAQLPNTAQNGTGLFNISNAANIEVDGSGTATISAPINDLAGGAPGVLTKDGSGTLILAGANSYTGGTTINGGILQIGTPNAPMNYNAAASGPLTVTITPADTSATGLAPLQVYGKAILNGPLILDLSASQTGGQYRIGNKYVLVAATKGVSGHFTSFGLTGPYAKYLSPILGYNAEEGIIDLQPSHQTVESGHVYGVSHYANDMALFDVLTVPPEVDANYWLHGIGSFGHMSGANYNYKGFLIGRGFNVTPDLIAGGAVSNVYTHTSGANGSFVDGTIFGAEIYGIYKQPRWTFTSLAGVGHLGNRATRYLPGLGAGKAANNGMYEGAFFRAAYALVDDQHLFVSPYAVARYLHTRSGRAQENGLGWMNTGYGQITTSQARLGGGLTGGYKTTTRYGMLTGWVGLGGAGTLGNTHTRVEETMGAQTYNLSVQAASVGLFTPSGGIQMVGKAAPWKLAVKWNSQIASRASAQAFTLEGSYKF